MQEYIREFSKYFMLLFMALYTLNAYLLPGGAYRRESVFFFFLRLQYPLIFLMGTAGYVSMYVQNGRLEFLFFYAFTEIMLFAAVVLFHALYPRGDELIPQNMAMLLTVGFMMLSRLSMEKALRQMAIVFCSLAVGLFVPEALKRFRRLRDYPYLFGVFGATVLTAVLLLGSLVNGSKLSFSLFGVTFQPSELVKLLFVLFVAAMYARSTSFLQIVLTGALSAFHVIVLVFSRDLGSALIFFVVYVLMTFLASARLYVLVLGICGGAGASYVAYRVFTHVQVRVQAWRDPWSVIDNEGYQITQSLFAICSGGLFGLGLLRGTPEDIPFVTTDFIFSAIAEELGLLFSLLLVLLCIAMFFTCMTLALRIGDLYYRLIVFGLGVCYIFQIFLTLGGGVKFIPLTGVTLPFISYGGSSVLSSVLMFSVVFGISAGMRGRFGREKTEAVRTKALRREAQEADDASSDSDSLRWRETQEADDAPLGSGSLRWREGRRV